MERFLHVSGLVLCSISCCIASLSILPGLKFRITKAGFNYANEVAMKILSKKVIGQELPDIKSDHYTLKEMTVTAFSQDGSSLSLVPPKNLQFKESDANLSLKGSFTWSYLFLSGSGTFDMHITGISLKVSASLDEVNNGTLHIKSDGCTCGIGDVKLNIHGSVLKIVSHLIQNSVKSNLITLACSIIRDAINKDVEQALSTLPVSVVIENILRLDYRLLAAPLFTKYYMETFHKGEMYWVNDSTEAPFSAADMPVLQNTSRMVYASISDYVAETMVYQAQRHGFLTYNLTANKLPPEDQGFLNTSCKSRTKLCIGNTIPELNVKYPECTVDLVMSSTATPMVYIRNDKIHCEIVGTISMFARRLDTKRSSPLLVLINVTIHAAINIFLKNETIFAIVDDIQLNSSVIKSALKEKINVKSLDALFTSALDLFVVSKLNELGAKGYPLPAMDDVSLINSELRFQRDSLVVATDLRYNGKSTTSKPDNLRFLRKYVTQYRYRSWYDTFVFMWKFVTLI